MVLILGSVTTAALVIVGILPMCFGVLSDRGWRSVVAAGSE